MSLYDTGSKHSRHYSKGYGKGIIRKIRSSKHRYVYFCTKDKGLKRYWLDVLKYPVLPYPKGTNKNYKLGEYLKEKYITDDSSKEFTLSEWLDELLGGRINDPSVFYDGVKVGLKQAKKLNDNHIAFCQHLLNLIDRETVKEV